MSASHLERIIGLLGRIAEACERAETRALCEVDNVVDARKALDAPATPPTTRLDGGKHGKRGGRG